MKSNALYFYSFQLRIRKKLWKIVKLMYAKDLHDVMVESLTTMLWFCWTLPALSVINLPSLLRFSQHCAWYLLFCSRFTWFSQSKDSGGPLQNLILYFNRIIDLDYEIFINSGWKKNRKFGALVFGTCKCATLVQNIWPYLQLDFKRKPDSLSMILVQLSLKFCKIVPLIFTDHARSDLHGHEY